MRRVTRSVLPVATQKALDRHQARVNQARADGTLNVERHWNGARKTKPLQTVLKILKQMAGLRERCMYCGDSHVALLQLDRREALEAGYRKTHRRILALFERALQHSDVDADALCHDLSEADDHGLLGWYLTGTGQHLSPFREIRAKHPNAWDVCVAALT
jgi:hypothetical protein